MTENRHLERLKSVTINDLADDLGVPDDLQILSHVFPESIPFESRPDSIPRKQIIESLNILVKQANFKANRTTILQGAWRCTHVFAHQNNRVCNVVNGSYRKENVIRKTCQKCCQKRTNPKTVREELLQLLVDDLILQGMSEQEARLKVYGEETVNELKEITT